MENLLAEDELRLRRLIENHLHYTNSARAKLILENWADYLPKFVKVMPVDYRRALQNRQNQVSTNKETPPAGVTVGE